MCVGIVIEQHRSDVLINAYGLRWDCGSDMIFFSCEMDLDSGCLSFRCLIGEILKERLRRVRISPNVCYKYFKQTQV